LVVTPTSSLATADVCGSAAWTSVTTVLCAPAAYRGSDVRTAMSVSAVAGTLMGQFSFDGAHACINSAPKANTTGFWIGLNSTVG
jgi:hypothetical protein